MLVEFEIFHINYEKENKDIEKCENLNQEYDEETQQEGYKSRYICDISGPIYEIEEVELSFKGKIHKVVTFTTNKIKTPYLNIDYDDFLALLQHIDKNFNWMVRKRKEDLIPEDNGITI